MRINLTILGLFGLLLLSSCHRKTDTLIGHWEVERVNVEFDESKANPEMIRQYGEIEKGNIVEIGKDSTLTFISGGDTLQGQCTLKGTELLLNGKPFGRFENGKIETETKTLLGKVKVSYGKN